MVEVNGVTNTDTAFAESSRTTGAASAVGSDEFLNLLVLQLQNQDPLDPMDNEKFITQLAQLQTLEQQRRMTEATTSLFLQQKLTSSASMIGRDRKSTRLNSSHYS